MINQSVLWKEKLLFVSDMQCHKIPEIVRACATSAQCLEVVDGEPRCPALWAELAAAPDRDDLLAEGLNHLTHLRDGGQDAIAFLADVLVSPDGLEGVT